MSDQDAASLFTMSFGIVTAHVLGAVVRLGVIDALDDDGTPVAEAAGRLGVSEPLLARLLRTAAALGVVAETTPGRYAPAGFGRALRRDDPSAMQALIRLATEPEFLASWAGLEGQLRTGEIAFDAAHGMPFFEHLARNPERSELFNDVMRGWTVQVTGPLAQRGGLDRFGTLVDVGGGNGSMLADLLAALPSLRGIVYDTPEGAAQAPATLAAAGVGDRCAVETGDFFVRVPAGDACLLKHIVHDWDDDSAVTILRHCRDAVPPAGRVLLVETVLPDEVGPGVPMLPYLLDMVMMTNFRGRERTRAEYAELFRRAGLEPDGETELPDTGFTVLEAVPARGQGETGPVR